MWGQDTLQLSLSILEPLNSLCLLHLSIIWGIVSENSLNMMLWFLTASVENPWQRNDCESVEQTKWSKGQNCNVRKLQLILLIHFSTPWRKVKINISSSKFRGHVRWCFPFLRCQWRCIDMADARFGFAAFGLKKWVRVGASSKFKRDGKRLH